MENIKLSIDYYLYNHTVYRVQSQPITIAVQSTIHLSQSKSNIPWTHAARIEKDSCNSIPISTWNDVFSIDFWDLMSKICLF